MKFYLLTILAMLLVATAFAGDAKTVRELLATEETEEISFEERAHIFEKPKVRAKCMREHIFKCGYIAGSGDESLCEDKKLCKCCAAAEMGCSQKCKN
mmetsp:Transcript_22225/g.22024  ORF Transcript_22225/g.22024 Transcript_22225/m.22024 type:complete len:98 (-) Transcript_22225:160-453(-)